MDRVASDTFDGPRGLLKRIADVLSRAVGHDALAAVDRIAIAAIFFLSGRTKVDDVLTVNDNAYALFRDEYKVPLIAPEVAAHIATYAEQ